jgi:DNA-binding NarL/FixJ family response regulator
VNPDPVRVAIVDDHPMFRMGLAAAIEEMDGIVLVGQAERADEVLALVESASPHVLLLDVRLADASGLEVNRWLAEHHPDVKVVMLTMSEDHDTAVTALRDGASGYLVKGAGPERVEHAVRTVAAGDVVLDQSLILAVTELAQTRRPPTTRPFPQLTQREFDILGLVAEGLDNASIARRLVLSPKTVRNHVSNIFAKIQAPDRPGAIVLAHRAGLGG